MFVNLPVIRHKKGVFQMQNEAEKKKFSMHVSISCVKVIQNLRARILATPFTLLTVWYVTRVRIPCIIHI